MKGGGIAVLSAFNFHNYSFFTQNKITIIGVTDNGTHTLNSHVINSVGIIIRDAVGEQRNVLVVLDTTRPANNTHTIANIHLIRIVGKYYDDDPEDNTKQGAKINRIARNFLSLIFERVGHFW